MARRTAEGKPGEQDLNEVSPPVGPMAHDPEAPKEAGLPTLACPASGKVEQPIDPPIRAFIKQANGSLISCEIVGMECDSGITARENEIEDEKGKRVKRPDPRAGLSMAVAAKGVTKYHVRTPTPAGEPVVTGTLTADRLTLTP